jgi:hypothetical protein
MKFGLLIRLDLILFAYNIISRNTTCVQGGFQANHNVKGLKGKFPTKHKVTVVKITFLGD